MAYIFFFAMTKATYPRTVFSIFSPGKLSENYFSRNFAFLSLFITGKSRNYVKFFLGEGVEVDISRFYIKTHAHSSHLQHSLFIAHSSTS